MLELGRISSHYFELFLRDELFESEKDNSKIHILEAYLNLNLMISEITKCELFCNQLLDLNPSSMIAHCSKLEICFRKNDWNEVIKECEYLIEHVKFEKDKHKAMYRKALALANRANKEDDFKNAITLCKSIVEDEEGKEKNTYADVYHTLSSIYQRLNDYLNQRKYAIKTFKTFPIEKKFFHNAINLLKGPPIGKEDQYNVKESMEIMSKLINIKNNCNNDKYSNKHRYFLFFYPFN
ncbi:MAG: hypothetical protein FH751_12735 [Firmicutes bacterium]|nr:hypothetical protein [Bacillota bacterium]